MRHIQAGTHHTRKDRAGGLRQGQAPTFEQELELFDLSEIPLPDLELEEFDLAELDAEANAMLAEIAADFDDFLLEGFSFELDADTAEHRKAEAERKERTTAEE